MSARLARAAGAASAVLACGVWLTAAAFGGQAMVFDFVADNESGTGQHSGTVTAIQGGHPNTADIVYSVASGEMKAFAFIDEATDTIYVSYGLEGMPGLVVLKEAPEGAWAGVWYLGGKTGKEIWTPKSQ